MVRNLINSLIENIAEINGDVFEECRYCNLIASVAEAYNVKEEFISTLTAEHPKFKENFV